MAYYLGIDLGTTYTAAAIERDGLVEALTLGNRTASVPSVVFLRDDGEILVGEAATRRAASEPGRVGREFKRRIGDPTPIILGGTPYAAEMLMARLLRWSVDKVREQQGGDPLGIALTHPANWGPYKLDLLTQAVRQVDLEAALFLPEPVAAATFYASQRRLDANAVVAVYDLGGGTFDAAMVRRTSTAFEIIGSPEGIERLGGIDFDEAVSAHVRTALGDALDHLDPEEPASVAAMTRLRQECIDAKEALSSDTDVSIPVFLPNLQTEVRLTRSEFEDMIRPAISETIVALRRSIRSAHVSDDEISAVLLVGGSSRIPLVAQMVAAELGRPIAIDAHPKDAISFGAAIAVAQKLGRATPESVKTVLPQDHRPPPPTMVPAGYRPPPPVNRPAPPVGRPGPPVGRPAPPAARPAVGAPAAARPGPPGGGLQHAANPAARANPTTPNPGVAAPRAPTPPGTPGAAATRPTPTTSPPVAGRAAPGGPPAARPGQGAVPSGGYPAQRPGATGVYNTQRPGAAGAHAAQRPVTSGGYPAQQPVSSGGYPAQRPSGGDDNRGPLLIAIAVVAGILVIILILLATRNGGDDDGAEGGSEDSGETAASDDSSAASDDGSSDAPVEFTQEMQDDFMSGCTTGADSATEGGCQCKLDWLIENASVEDTIAWYEDPDAYPEITEGLASCGQ